MKKKNLLLFLFYSCHSNPTGTSHSTETRVIELEKNLKKKEVEIKDLKKEIEDLKNNNSNISSTQLENENKELEENLKTKEREIEDLRKELENIKNQNDYSGTILEKLKKHIKRLFLERTPFEEFINKSDKYKIEIERYKDAVFNVYNYLRGKSSNDLVNKLFEGEFLQGKKIIIKGGFFQSIREVAENLKEEEITYIFDQFVFGQNFFMRIYFENDKKYLDICFGKNILIKYEIEFRKEFLVRLDSKLIFRSLIFNSEFDKLKNNLNEYFSSIEIVK